MNSFLSELRRRKVFNVGIAYAVVAWVLIQIVISVKEPLRLPEWADTLIIVILAVGFPLAVILAWVFDRTPEGIVRTPPKAADAVPEPADEVPSIAVLPFADMSPEKDQEYFADGLTEELLNSLARIKGLRVSGRTSSFYFKDKHEDLRTIGDKLGVRHVLEGSVRKSGERLRITAQLIDAGSDHHLWSETFDRTLDDLFEIQEEIARSVAGALEITLGVGDVGGVPGMTHNVSAYEQFLLGGVTRHFDIGEVLSEQGLREGIRHLERAVALDPEFALAWVGLHQLYRLSTDLLFGGVTDSAQKGDLALGRAQELAPDSPFVLYQTVLRQVGDRDWVAADETYQAAVEAAAKHSVQDFFNYQSGLILQMFGRAREAIECYERGRAVDPLHVNNASYLCDAYSSTGRWELGLAEADRFASLSGENVVNLKANALQAAMVSGDRVELDKRLGQLIDTEGGHPIGIRMRTLLDDPAAARTELRQMLKDPANEAVLFRNIISTWAAYFDDSELALELLRVNLIEQNTWAVFLIWRGVYRDVRRLPGFKDLLRDLGLVDYWRETGKWADFVRPLGGDDFECIG